MFETLTLEGALYVAQNTREINRTAFMSCVPEVSPETFAINRWKTDGPAWQLVENGIPVAMGGIEMVSPWLGIAWMSVTDKADSGSWKKLIRFSRKVFSNARLSIQRIEAHCTDAWGMSGKYLEAIGFEYEFTRRMATKTGGGIRTYVIFGENYEHS